jgi:hypothetical protein
VGSTVFRSSDRFSLELATGTECPYIRIKELR